MTLQGRPGRRENQCVVSTTRCTRWSPARLGEGFAALNPACTPVSQISCRMQTDSHQLLEAVATLASSGEASLKVSKLHGNWPKWSQFLMALKSCSVVFVLAWATREAFLLQQQQLLGSKLSAILHSWPRPHYHILKQGKVFCAICHLSASSFFYFWSLLDISMRWPAGFVS